MNGARILAGRPIAEAIRAEVAAGVTALVASGAAPPGLTAVLVGDDPASQVYVRSKTRGCAETGMRGDTLRLPGDVAQAELLATIDRLNADDAVDGILVQLPLPERLDEPAVLERVHPDKDVDGFHPVNVGRLWLDRPGFVSATPAGVMELLRRSGVALAGRHAVIVGRSAIVGKPMAALLLRAHCTVTVCHSRTPDLAALCRQADVLVAAVGRPGLIGPAHVRDGAVVIDVGINRLDGQRDAELVGRLCGDDPERARQLAEKGSVLVGDVDFRAVAPIASAISPVPGGVGLLTVAMVLANTLAAARRRRGPS